MACRDQPRGERNADIHSIHAASRVAARLPSDRKRKSSIAHKQVQKEPEKTRGNQTSEPKTSLCIRLLRGDRADECGPAGEPGRSGEQVFGGRPRSAGQRIQGESLTQNLNPRHDLVSRLPHPEGMRGQLVE